MKFLHIADLHIGRRIGDIPLYDDQKYILNQIVEIAEDEKVDAVLIAGDVYQKASPQSDAMTIFNDFVTSIVSMGIKVFVVSGNHDSGQRISYFSELIKKSGVFVTEKFEGLLQKIEMTDEHGSMGIYMLPFIRPINVRKCYPEETITNYTDAIKTVLANSEIDESQRKVLIMHQFITGAEITDSEERTVGGVDNIDGHLFDAFDYVALGHIHKSQKVGRETMRYAGSPMKYSLSEANHIKSVTVVEMKEKGAVDINTVPLKHIHDVRVIEGLLEEVMDLPYSEDFVQVTLKDEMVRPDARVKISTVFPNMIKFAVQNSSTSFEEDVIGAESIEGKSILDLFIDFYSLQSNNVLPTDQQLELVREIIDELEEEKDETN